MSTLSESTYLFFCLANLFEFLKIKRRTFDRFPWCQI